MTRKAISFLLCLAVGVTGCASLRKKFVREKNYHKPVTPIRPVKVYEEPAVPAELYRKHYTRWQFWQQELIDGIGANQKQAGRAVQEAVAELRYLQGLLSRSPDHVQRLEGYIGALLAYQGRIAVGWSSAAAAGDVREDVDRMKRDIQRDFAYRHVSGILAEASSAQGDAGP